MSEYQCPRCGSPDGLWEGVEIPGWRSVNSDLSTLAGGFMDREADWTGAESTGEYGCGECGWEGFKSGLAPLITEEDTIHPEQQRLL